MIVAARLLRDRRAATLGWAALLPGVVAMRGVQFVMLCFIGTGLVGITLHV